VTEEFADLLHDLGYYVNCCGTETTLQVGVPYIRGQRRPAHSQELRAHVNSCICLAAAPRGVCSMCGIIPVNKQIAASVR
jgi:hypothetical protein